MAKSSLPRIRRHLLNHGQDQLAVAVIEVGGIAANLAQEADFVVGKLRQSLGAVGVARFGEELRERDLHGAGDFRKRVERRDGVAVLYARKVAAQQASALFDVSLRHAFLQPVVSDGLADVDGRKHCRMRHSNQIGIFWQGEISAMTKLVQSRFDLHWNLWMLRHCASNNLMLATSRWSQFQLHVQGSSNRVRAV